MDDLEVSSEKNEFWGILLEKVKKQKLAWPGIKLRSGRPEADLLTTAPQRLVELVSYGIITYP